jgi:hypothetical protein
MEVQLLHENLERIMDSAISYPGQNMGTYNVTIESAHTITISSNLSTAQMGIVIVNGVLNLSPSTSPNTIDYQLHLSI